MTNLIYQVAVGEPSALYEHCINSVAEYCKKYSIEHIIQREPILRIAPDFTRSGRSENVAKRGYLPIFEKENAFNYLKDTNALAIIDADIYIRDSAPNIFSELQPRAAIALVSEREMDIQPWYQRKILHYSIAQYGNLHDQPQRGRPNFKPNDLGYEFYNMGMMLINSKNFLPYLKGDSPRDFINRPEFKDFVDGIGQWKWSTDQTLLNYFLKVNGVPTQHLSPVWNGLYNAVNNIKYCHFVHFFLKDKLPSKGENVSELMATI
jgi:hypothetical protein